MNVPQPADELPAGWRRCPRCRARCFDLKVAALSRTTRDGGAWIDVCSHCGELEAVTQTHGQLAPFTDWPLSPDRLAQEERAWYAQMQTVTFKRWRIRPDEAEGMLGD